MIIIEAANAVRDDHVDKDNYPTGLQDQFPRLTMTNSAPIIFVG